MGKIDAKTLLELETAIREKLKTANLREVERQTGITSSRLSAFRREIHGFKLEKLNTLANHFEVRFRIENW